MRRLRTGLSAVAVALALAACRMAGPAGGGLADGECLDPAASGDADVVRVAAALAAGDLCVRERSFVAGGRRWRLVEIDGGRRGPLHVVPHDDEDAAFPVALHALALMGGRIVAVEAGEARRFGGIDPNRHFSDGRASAAGCPGGAPDPAFARAVLAGAGRTVVAYHTNDPGYAGDGRGGAGTISVRRKSERFRPFPAAGADEDAVVIVAGRSDRPGGRAARDVARLNAAGVNVVWEVVAPETDDCSLSNHFALTRGPRYFNVEVGHGDVAAGRRMVDALAPLVGGGL